MPEITYESVQPLLASQQVQGGMIVCTFRCPESGVSVEARAHIQKTTSAAGRVAQRAKQTAKHTLLFQARSALSRAVGGLLGHGLAGQIGRGVAHSAATEATRGSGTAAVTFSDAEKQAAVVAAFQSVAAQFAWDAKGGRWISAKLAGDVLTDFARQLDAAPVAQKYDLGVLARMLAEIANADGQIGDEEKGFLADFVPADVGSVDALLARPPLSKVELDETSAGAARETMLMVAWALALTDEDLADAEQARLAALAQGLGIADDRAAELQRYAQLFVVAQAIEAAYAAGAADPAARQQILDLATKIGLDADDAERAEIKYRKRAGIL